jgi:hypothetical protein
MTKLFGLLIGPNSLLLAAIQGRPMHLKSGFRPREPDCMLDEGSICYTTLFGCWNHAKKGRRIKEEGGRIQPAKPVSQGKCLKIGTGRRWRERKLVRLSCQLAFHPFAGGVEYPVFAFASKGCWAASPGAWQLRVRL